MNWQLSDLNEKLRDNPEIEIDGEKPKAESPLELEFLRQWLGSFEAAGLPEPIHDKIKPVDGRKWRFDFAWPAIMIAVEIEGGTYGRGRHTRHAGFKADCEKYNAATAAGWRVYRFTGDMVTSGEAVDFMIAVIEKEIENETDTN